jgi:uncharacterized Fe-S cluster protein YjdI
MADAKHYSGEGVTITFDARRCLHAGRCVQGLPEVFDTARRPWILPEGASAERIAEVVRHCPSGALHYEVAGGPAEAPMVPTHVSARPGEPLWLRGDLRIDTAEGEFVETRAALCTCGTTANAPFCDASGDCKAWQARVAELDG